MIRAIYFLKLKKSPVIEIRIMKRLLKYNSLLKNVKRNREKFFIFLFSTPRIPLGLRLNFAHPVPVGGVRRTPRCR
jgi:hypothetical protein